MTQRSKNREKRMWYRGSRILLWVVGIQLLLLGSFLFLDWFEIRRIIQKVKIALITHPYFSIQKIDVVNLSSKVPERKKVGGAEVIAMTGLRNGINIWKVSPQNIEKIVKSHPWVKHVLVRREYPQRVIIEIKEWEPKGIIVLLGKLYYTSADGTVFKEVSENENVDLPMITGIDRSEIDSQTHSKKRRLAEALKLGGDLEKSPITLSEIHFKPGGEIVLYSNSHTIAIHMGWGDWSSKVHRLLRVLSEWDGKEKHLDSLDLSFRSQVIARLKKEI